MRKILLSFLGTNNYLDCNYYLEGQPEKKVDNVKYIQEALVKMYCTDFSKDDEVLLFLTEKAETMNFLDNGQFTPKTKSLDFPNKGLKSKLETLQNAGFQFELNHKRIKEGFSQEEIWSIFETVADEIQEGDQVILDITHAFRFLPMLGIVLLNYLKTTKNVNVIGIHYGAFEKLGSFQEVKEMKIEDRNAPILDLKTLLEFQTWTSAVNSFVKFGEIKELSGLSQPEIQNLMTKSKGADLVTKDLRYIIDQLAILTSNLQTNRLNILLDQDFLIFKEKLEKLHDTEITVKPFNQILKLIERKVTPIITSKELIWLESAKWCLEHKLVQQAFTQLQEGLLTYSMSLFEREIISSDEVKISFEKHQAPKIPERGNIHHRLFYSSLLYFIYKTSQNKIKEDDSADFKEISQLFQTDFFINLGSLYAHITEPRNDINHAGIRNDPMKADALQKRISELIAKAESLLNDSELKISNVTPMLLNLSNHPTSSWPEKQIVLAKAQYGHVVDMPFPQIDPILDEDGLADLAGHYVTKMMELKPKAVHLMGELTFCFALIPLLQSHGITCIASTTHRTTEDRPDGTKISKFEFVRFRKYVP